MIYHFTELEEGWILISAIRSKKTTSNTLLNIFINLQPFFIKNRKNK